MFEVEKKETPQLTDNEVWLALRNNWERELLAVRWKSTVIYLRYVDYTIDNAQSEIGEIEGKIIETHDMHTNNNSNTEHHPRSGESGS